ncbi:MAG: DUF4838 domain-containing protein [Rikenellaceae bacterium]
MKKTTLILTLLLSASAAFAQIDLTKSRIVIDKDQKVDEAAATLMVEYVNKISGKQLSIVDNTTKLKSGDIIIGKANSIDDKNITKDGFSVKTTDGKLRIISGEGEGSVYGVCDVLEKYFGVRYWSAEAFEIPESQKMIIAEDIDYTSNPTFEYRQIHGDGQQDAAYKAFHRLKLPKEVFAGGLWVHTFFRLFPNEVYGVKNPEYYAEILGERRSGKQIQPCLTNEAVYETMVAKLDSVFKANPEKTLISVSQNDGKGAYCRCEKCKAIDDYEESPVGSVLHFVNRIAERFPDKEISTLAYTYTVKPPKHMKPRENVNIMLCNIECTRQLALPYTNTGKTFVGYMEEWSKLTNNIFMWDYGINFDNTVSPFPNFHTLQENIQLFYDNHVTKLFEQVNSYKGVDFSELRAYVLAKLMWDKDRDIDELMKEFVYGYYKEAAPYIYDYLKLQQGGLIASEAPLVIYESPVCHKNGFLNVQLMKEYERLFNKAEEAVKDNPEILDRVRLSRLSLQYAQLEIFRTIKGVDVDDLSKRVALFKERTKYFGVTDLNAKKSNAQAYCDDYAARYLVPATNNLAAGAKIQWISEPTGRYLATAEEVLTDGLFGGNSFVESWVGWEGTDAEFIVDMGEVKEFSTVETDFLHQVGQWVFLPKHVSYAISEDGENFTEFGSFDQPEDRSTGTIYKKYTETRKGSKARYIKIKAENIKVCPAWHGGIGGKAWFFLDEIVVN